MTSERLLRLDEEIRHLHAKLEAQERAIRQLEEEVRRIFEEQVFSR